VSIPIEQLADEMYAMVAECQGRKNVKPADLIKAMIARHSEANCTRNDCKQALRTLIDSERCVYSYFGESYVTLPHKEGAAPEE
jgi:hypothetical protein